MYNYGHSRTMDVIYTANKIHFDVESQITRDQEFLPEIIKEYIYKLWKLN